jgi:hypothetical protein
LAQFDPYYLIARRLAKDQFNRNDLLTITEFMTEDIERLVGPRLTDKHYEFEGIYYASSHARMEFSEERGNHFTKIRLSAGSSKDPGGAIWQLAHECVHLITPSWVGSTVLEEGIACWYQERWVDKIPQVFPDWYKNGRSKGRFPSYDEAWDLVNKLVAPDQDVIKRLRAAQPVISKIGIKLLNQEAPWLEREVARKLASRFKRGRPGRKRKGSQATTVQPALVQPSLFHPASTDSELIAAAEKNVLVMTPPLPPLEEACFQRPLPFDARSSEIGRQAARLRVGMPLKLEQLAAFKISVAEVHSAFEQIYGVQA